MGRSTKTRNHNGELISLFAGAGGLDLGFEKARFSVAAAIDLRTPSIDSYNHNRKHRVGHVGDITALDARKIDALAGRTLQPIGIIGGPPCQSFSRATHSADDDHRHELPLEFARILAAYNRRSPISFFAFENVPGLLKRRHFDRYAQIILAFEKAGFCVGCGVLNASWFGVAQNRPRLILVGFNKTIFPGLKWCPPAEPAQLVRTPVRDVIKDLPKPTYWRRDLDKKLITPHPNHWCMMPKSKNFTTPGALVPGTARGRSFRTLDWNEPSPTVAYGNREVHIHPNGKRRLSVYEAMLLQGFPQEYVLTGSLSDQIVQVSEAVPPPLAHAIAESILDAMQHYSGRQTSTHRASRTIGEGHRASAS
jgi:DNA (cytosine-5)-methyltransferase 1